MPFAGYASFEECVSRNRDKRDPDAYCGSIKHQVEDKSSDLAKAGRSAAGVARLFAPKRRRRRG